MKVWREEGNDISTVGDQVVELIYGHWRGQIVHAGAALGVFDHLATGEAKNAETLAAELGVDSGLLYRLLRALASLGLLAEGGSRSFSISEAGELLRSDHPQSLRDRVLLADGPEHYAVWKHLPEMIRDGRQDGFVREFGVTAFEYARRNSGYRRTFDQAMTNYSVVHAALVLEALRDYDFSNIRTLCDVAGGHGYLICAVLNAHPHLSGIVLDLPEVVSDSSQLAATKLGLGDRCAYVGGDMFRRGPDRGCLYAEAHSPRLERSGLRPDLIQHPRGRFGQRASLHHRAHRAGAGHAPFRKTLRHAHDVLGDRSGEDGERVRAPPRGCGMEMRRFVVPEQSPDWSDRRALGYAHARPDGDRRTEWEAGAMSVPDSPGRSSDTSAQAAILRFISGFMASQALYVITKLGIPDLLKEGPKDSKELAQATGTHAASLNRVLRALAGVGVVAQDETGRFALTSLGLPLQTGVPGSLHAWVLVTLGGEHYQAWGDLMHSVCSGEIAFNHVFGTDVWSYRAGHPGGGDVYILSRIIHDWDDEQAATILGNCRRAMREQSKLLMIERVLPPQHRAL